MRKGHFGCLRVSLPRLGRPGMGHVVISRRVALRLPLRWQPNGSAFIKTFSPRARVPLLPASSYRRNAFATVETNQLVQRTLVSGIQQLCFGFSELTRSKIQMLIFRFPAPMRVPGTYLPHTKEQGI